MKYIKKAVMTIVTQTGQKVPCRQEYAGFLWVPGNKEELLAQASEAFTKQTGLKVKSIEYIKTIRLFE